MNEKIRTYNGDILGIAVLGYSLFLFCLVFAFAGCAPSATQVKKDIATDLTQISQIADCPTACEALKLYIKTKLGGL